jgi:hypothetical protein
VDWIAVAVTVWVCRCLGGGAVMPCDRMPVAGDVVACDGWMGLGVWK